MTNVNFISARDARNLIHSLYDNDKIIQVRDIMNQINNRCLERKYNLLIKGELYTEVEFLLKNQGYSVSPSFDKDYNINTWISWEK